MRRALLLVDAQKNMLEGTSPVPDADRLRSVLRALLSEARMAGAAVVHVQNNGGPDDPDAPGTPGWDLVFPVQESELVIQKTQGNAFSQPELTTWLRAKRIDDVVIAGMQSEFCIRDTARGALSHGFGVILVGDGHATYGDSLQSASEVGHDIEQELVRDGVRITVAQDVRYV